MNKKILFPLFLFLNLTLLAQVQGYYNGLDLTKTGNDLFIELAGRIESTHSGIPYTSSSTDVWDACRAADEDPDISSNVLLIYGYDDTDGDSTTDRTRAKDSQDTGGTTGTWNREHVFAKSLANPSLGTDSPGPGTDVHNLRPADTQRNSSRSNKKLSNGSGVASYATSNGGWYPGDEWKGDVARIVMYMYLRYHGSGGQVSETNCLPKEVGIGAVNTMDSNMIELFLNWNVEDPVSDFEANRNEVLAGIQMNRNPFIDNPYLATVIWGGLNAEDKWWSTGSSDTEVPTAPSNVVASNITDESFDLNWTASTDNVGVYDYLIYVDGVYLQTSASTSASITNLTQSTSYTITIKARDAASNLSVESAALDVTTLEGPFMLISEDFNDCASLEFFAYSEASSKNWTCYTQYGENNSGSYGINGYQETVLSKDWLITNNPIDFDTNESELLSFYTDAAYGTTPLALVYSLDYNGSGDPSNFTWINVPNISIPIHSNGSGTEEVYTFSNVDISSITGSVYIAFKYYSDGVPTRWTVDSFEISATEPNEDSDNDGVLDSVDACPNTPNGETVDANGCSEAQRDDDGDGVVNGDDVCANTPNGETVNAEGCSESQLDDDNDGVMNNLDVCANTPNGETVDGNGCSYGQLDDDNDGVQNSDDVCANTPGGETVNAEGCSDSQLDDDNDGVMNNIDICANTPNGETVDGNGCSEAQRDDDGDGVVNGDDVCPNTPNGETVNAEGCSESQLDDDNDGVMNNVDVCANTPSGETVDAEGCSESQLDDDNDGVMNNMDVCPNTTTGANVDSVGCFTLPSNNFSVETIGETCAGEKNGQLIITANLNYNYTVTIDGNDYSFTDSKTIEDLSPNTYEVCIVVDNENYEQCFTIMIEEAQEISGKTSATSNKVSIEIEQGTAPYFIAVNGVIVNETYNKSIEVDGLKQGDEVMVKTSVSCEGILLKRIDNFENIVAYPNPTNGIFQIGIPGEVDKLEVQLYNIHSQLISSKMYDVQFGNVQFNIENQPSGVYFVKIVLDEIQILRIVKQ